MAFKNVFLCSLVSDEVKVGDRASLRLVTPHTAARCKAGEVVWTGRVLHHSPGVIVTRNSVYLYDADAAKSESDNTPRKKSQDELDYDMDRLAP